MTDSFPRQLQRRIVMSLLFAVGLACGRGSGGPDTPIHVTDVLRRGQLTVWETRRSMASGVEFEVPVDRCGFVDRPSLGVAIEMHTVPPPPGVYDDKKCLLEMRITRNKKEELGPDGLFGAPAPNASETEKQFAVWLSRHHQSIDRLDGGQFTHYRYDVTCPNGDVLTTITNITNVYQDGVSLHEKEDEAIVRRVLGSLRCVDPAS